MKDDLHAVSRQPSRRRQQLRKMLRWQALASRVLAFLAVLTLLGGGVAWLVRGTGSALIGIMFLVFAAIMVGAVLLFLQMLRVISGEKR